MRFVHKFVNGYHVSFDTVNFENTHVFFLKKDADEAVKQMNSRQGAQRSKK